MRGGTADKKTEELMGNRGRRMSERKTKNSRKRKEVKEGGDRKIEYRQLQKEAENERREEC